MILSVFLCKVKFRFVTVRNDYGFASESEISSSFLNIKLRNHATTARVNDDVTFSAVFATYVPIWEDLRDVR